MELFDKVEKVDISKVIPYHNNPKEHPPQQVDKIASSIKHYGFTQPIVIDEDNEIIIGHGRYEASKKLGLAQIPAIRRDDLTEAEAKALRIADNKVAESEWNFEALEVEFETIDIEELETGFTPEELEAEGFEGYAEEEEGDNQYTDKITSPQYEPMGLQPQIYELFDAEKYKKLLEKVENSSLSEKKKNFLRMATYRHIIFDYENIAEYYAHAEPEMQELMEELALVIIDFEDAIEQGFAEISEEVLSTYGE